jgi:hypothetical protein
LLQGECSSILWSKHSWTNWKGRGSRDCKHLRLSIVWKPLWFLLLSKVGESSEADVMITIF